MSTHISTPPMVDRVRRDRVLAALENWRLEKITSEQYIAAMYEIDDACTANLSGARDETLEQGIAHLMFDLDDDLYISLEDPCYVNRWKMLLMSDACLVQERCRRRFMWVNWVAMVMLAVYVGCMIWLGMQGLPLTLIGLPFGLIAIPLCWLKPRFMKLSEQTTISKNALIYSPFENKKQMAKVQQQLALKRGSTFTDADLLSPLEPTPVRFPQRLIDAAVWVMVIPMATVLFMLLSPLLLVIAALPARISDTKLVWPNYTS